MFSGLVGGVNVAQVPEQIAETDMQLCENFLYDLDSQRLVGRGGLSAPLTTFQNPIRDLFYDVDTNVLVAFLETRETYAFNNGYNQTPSFLGTVSGTKSPSCVKFMDKLWIASGGVLQYSNFNSITLIPAAPTCDLVFQRFGRLAAIQTGNDRITYSDTGDGTGWSNDSNVASSSQWLDVGYGDSGDIIAVVPLATDMIIIKSNGMIYQFTGDSDWNSWNVYNIANNADPVGVATATNIGDSVVLLSTRGLKSLTTTMDYGNITPNDIGDKFNKLITTNMYEPKICHLKRRSTIMIRPTTDKTYWIAFNYRIGAATVIRFGLPITSIVETTNDVLVASGTCLYKWANEYATDNGVEISYHMKPKDVIGSDEMLVKAIDTKFSSDRAGTVNVATSTLSVGMPANSRRKVRCNHSTDCISLDVTSTTRFELDHIALDISDL